MDQGQVDLLLQFCQSINILRNKYLFKTFFGEKNTSLEKNMTNILGQQIIHVRK